MKFPILIALFAASPAVAQCPVAADLAAGVRVIETSGTVNVFLALEGGVVQQDGVASDGYTFRNVLAQGTHLIEISDTENGAVIEDTLITIAYPVAPADLPRPSPLTTARYETNLTSSTDRYSEIQTQSWGAMTTLSIGDCTYDMIPGKLTYTNSDYVVFEGLHYLPALELALLHSYQIQGESVDRYIAARIEVVE